MRRALPEFAAGLSVAAFVVSACSLTADLDSLKGSAGSAATGGAGTGGIGGGGTDGGGAGGGPKLPLARVSAGALHGCVIDADGTVFCWGSNLAGQLGNGITGGRQAFFQKVGLGAKAEAVSCGGQHTCALAGGTAYCWGRGLEGQLTGGKADRNVPGKIEGLTNVTRISAGGNHTCAIAGGALHCWGSNGRGQLGVTGTDSVTPLKVNLMTPSEVAAGPLNTCAVAAGKAYCWGANDFGQVGDKTLPLTQSEPAEVALAGEPLAVSTGGQHACAALKAGSVHCWGSNKSGQLGIGSSGEVGVAPAAVASLIAGSIALGEAHSCALETQGGGQVACWGADDRGQVGDGAATSALVPATITQLSGVSQIAAGIRFSCALSAGGGALHCWGDNMSSQLGALAADFSPEPVSLSLTKP